MARALTEAGHEVIVFTRPGRPWDIEGFAGDTPEAPIPLDRKIDGVRHICLPMPPLPRARPIEHLRTMADVLTEAFYVFRPAAVMAASNWETAEPARRAAGRMGAAFFYEQRGFWEMGAALTPARQAEAARAETDIALGARAVFTLNSLMRDEMVRRGVPAGRIHLVPNGTSRPGRIDPSVTRAAIGCRAAHLLGYIGSLSDYEGVGDLLELVARLRRGGAGVAGLDVDALIVGSDAPKGLIGGSGPAEAALRAQAGRLAITPHVHFIPQLPEDAVNSHYTLCDAIVMPRRSTPVTALVPPIKPYTAATYNLPVFMTDLPPLAEIAAEIHGSLFAPGDLDGLVGQVHQALTRGHRASVTVLDAGLDWSQRVAPVVQHLDSVAEAERARNLALFGAVTTAPITAGAPPANAVPANAAPASAAPVVAGFDMTALPLVGLQGLIAPTHEARVGPEPVRSHSHVTRLSRATLLEVLATATPARLVIDWAGLLADPEFAAGRGEWAGLWSINEMRLNRQIMDAVRIALARGWRVQVLGPVHRSQAPLFRTVAQMVEEILPGADAPVSGGPA